MNEAISLSTLPLRLVASKPDSLVDEGAAVRVGADDTGVEPAVGEDVAWFTGVAPGAAAIVGARRSDADAEVGAGDAEGNDAGEAHAASEKLNASAIKIERRGMDMTADSLSRIIKTISKYQVQE
jgi:hypothetical protein